MAFAEPQGDKRDYLAVEVVYSPQAGVVDSVSLRLPAGALLADALQASGLLQRHGLPVESLRVGVWSRQQPLDAFLRDRDRVEIYRPLIVDPKEARRLRYSQHRQRLAAAANAVANTAVNTSADASTAPPGANNVSGSRKP